MYPLLPSPLKKKKQDKVATVFEALNLLELPESVTVEFFVGSFNSGLLLSLASKVRTSCGIHLLAIAG